MVFICAGLIALLLAISPARACAQSSVASSTPTPAGWSGAPQAAAPTIAPGTIVTTQNWQQYQDFMPDGMIKLYAGAYSLKIPDDARLEVGDTIVHQLPQSYLDATEKFAAQVNLIELPDGGLTLQGYQGGRPFPNPVDPHRGWKILANLWYRYMPYLQVEPHASGCLVSSGGGFNCRYVSIVYRQLDYITDPGVPVKTPGAEGKFFSQWLMVTEPEQSRYTAVLTISYDDLQREEDSYIFLPALRRYQPISTLARCSPNQGTDSTQEEYRNGFDSNLTQMKVDYLGEKKILALLPEKMPTGQFPVDFDMPLGWPKPSWGKWQMRDVDVISLSKLPDHAHGYCYGKRVMYVDRVSSQPIWEDLYDTDLKLWRIYALFLHPIEAPKVGVVEASGAMVYAFWDVQKSHTTFFVDPADGTPHYLNEQASQDYFDVARYTEPSGLNLIMR